MLPLSEKVQCSGSTNTVPTKGFVDFGSRLNTSSPYNKENFSALENSSKEAT